MINTDMRILGSGVGCKVVPVIFSVTTRAKKRSIDCLNLPFRSPSMISFPFDSDSDVSKQTLGITGV